MGTAYTKHEFVPERLKDFRDVFLLDLSWHMYRSYFAFRTLGTMLDDGIFHPSGHVYGTLRAVMDIRYNYPDAAIILCVDRRPIHRYEMYPEYKAGRTKQDYNIFSDIRDIFKMAFGLRGIFSAVSPDLEADDVICALARKVTSDPLWSGMAYMYSGDDDLMQVVSPRIHIVRGIEAGCITKVFSPEAVLEKYGVTPAKFLLYRSVIGDKSDNVPGVYRFLRKVLARIVQESSTIEEMFRMEIPGITIKEQKYLVALIEQREMVTRNYHLMQLVDGEVEILEDYDQQRALQAARKWDMNSLISYISQGR